MFKKFFTVVLMISAGWIGTAHADFEEGRSAVLADFGFSRGGMHLGFEYENAFDKTYGLGGYFRMYPDDDAPSYAPEITTIGAFVRPHFNRQNWDFFVSPGFGMIFYDPNNGADDETLLGPSLQIGLLYEMTPQFSLGMDEMQLWSWFGEDSLRGEVSTSDVFTIKGRFIF